MWRTIQKQDRGAKQREQSTAIQGAKISHDGIQGAKIHFKVRNSLLAHECHFAHLKVIFAPCESRCENFTHLNSRCEIYFKVRNSIFKVRILKNQFRTPLFKVRNSLLAHECHFAHLKPLFAPCETRCEIFAQCEIECEMQFKVRISQFKVRNFRTMQSKVRNFQFKVRKFRTVKFKMRKFRTVKF